MGLQKESRKTRENWIIETRNRVSREILGCNFDEDIDAHHETLINAAYAKTF